LGLFSKLFGSKQPAPPCAIHPDDKDLVREEDIRWWHGLSLDDCKALEQEDNVFRLAAFQKFIEDEGLSDSDAGRKVRLRFPTYYGSLDQRANERFALTAADAKLPYVLKDRVNRAAMNRLIDRQAVERASSVNALIRQLIRGGRI